MATRTFSYGASGSFAVGWGDKLRVAIWAVRYAAATSRSISLHFENSEVHQALEPNKIN